MLFKVTEELCRLTEVLFKVTEELCRLTEELFRLTGEQFRLTGVLFCYLLSVMVSIRHLEVGVKKESGRQNIVETNATPDYEGITARFSKITIEDNTDNIHIYYAKMVPVILNN